MRYLLAPLTIALGAFLLPLGCAEPNPAEGVGEDLADLRGKHCGNGVCGTNETCSSCPQDCGPCSADPPPPDPSAPDAGPTLPAASVEYGPDPATTCPAGAVSISPGEDIPAVVSSHAAGTTFCILAGTHYPTSPINPRTGDALIGQYGAVIDGSHLAPMSYDVGSTSIIRGWNCSDCANVTVRNLVVQNLAAYTCIGMYNGGDGWTVDHNDVSGCHMGVSMGNGARVTNNRVHHNFTYAMGGYLAVDDVIDHNEIAYSGGTPDPGGSTACTKWGGGTAGVANLSITNNYVHDCNTTGLWLDGSGSGTVIAGNRIENNVRGGIEWEVSAAGTIRDNTLSGNGVAIFISTSQGVDIYNNVIKQPTGMALEFFVDAAAINADGRPSTFSFSDNYFHGNHVDLSAHAVDYAIGLSCSNTTTCAAYGTPQNNRFEGNTYDTGGRSTSAFWLWGGGRLTWSQWQAIPEDVGGTVL